MILKDSFCKSSPDIKYPCDWEYKVILDENINANDYIKDILKCDFKIKLSKTTPKYKSYNISINVKNQEERLEIFTLLKKSCKYVL